MKRALCIAAALSLSLLLAGPSFGQQQLAKPQITDPAGDANFVNDQGTGDGSIGDNTTADAGNASDLMGVTFSNDAKNLYVVIQTEATPPATQGIGFRVRVNGEPAQQCLFFEVFYPGAGNALAEPEAYMRDTCEGGAGEAVAVEVLGSQLTIPRSASPSLAKGKTLTKPQAQSFVYGGSSPPAGLVGPHIDTTKVGSDYKLKK